MRRPGAPVSGSPPPAPKLCGPAASMTTLACYVSTLNDVQPCRTRILSTWTTSIALIVNHKICDGANLAAAVGHGDDLLGEPLKVALRDADVAEIDVVLAVRIKARGDEDDVRLECSDRRQDLVPPRPPPQAHLRPCTRCWIVHQCASFTPLGSKWITADL